MPGRARCDGRAGKLRSSINARRHGLLSKCTVLDGECPDTFATLLQQHVDKLSPADDLEFSQVEEMAAAAWRLRRTWSTETNIFNKAIEESTAPTFARRIADAFSQLSTGQELNLIDRYETRFHRSYQRSLLNLAFLREVAGDNEETSILPNEPSEEEPPISS